MDLCQVWVSRRPGEKEKYLRKNVVPKDKNGSVSLMVWGCFIGNMKSPLVTLHGKHNADVYVTVLCETLVPFIETLPPDLRRDFIYQ